MSTHYHSKYFAYELTKCCLCIRTFKTRDEQEVAGYLEMLALILNVHGDMRLTEALIL